jgi:hypothetical protein
MKGSSKRASALQALAVGLVLAVGIIGPASAYVGPGAGLTAIGVVVAMIATVFLAVVGFVWYPVKRFLRKRRPPWKSGDREGAPRARAVRGLIYRGCDNG